MYYIGIDLGGTNIAAGIVDKDFNIIKKDSVPTLAQRKSEEIVADMGALCNKLIADANLKTTDIEYVGIAAPGAVNPETGVISYICNLPFVNFNICEELKKHVAVKKVYLENDANAAALGEAKIGASKGVADSIMITLGTGLGGGIIINHKVYSGFNYAGGELGHVVIEYNGRPCNCGRKGCWESYSSATALVKMTKEKMEECKDSAMWAMCEGNIENASARTAFNAKRAGDKAGDEVVDKYIDYLVCGLVNMINIFQPEIITIGGGISNERDYLLDLINAKIEKEQYTRDNSKKTKVMIAQLRNDAGIIGAAALGI